MSFAVSSDKSLGIKQTWQDVTASRAKSTIYTNTTGKPIFIAVASYVVNNINDCDLYIDETLVISNVIGNSNTTKHTGAYAIIPNGSTYRFESPRALNYWWELR